MKMSLYTGETRNLDRCVEAIVETERRGMHAV